MTILTALASIASAITTVAGMLKFWRPKPGPDVKPLPVPSDPVAKVVAGGKLPAPPPVPAELKKPV